MGKKGGNGKPQRDNALFAERLRIALATKKWKAARLAKELGISRQATSAWTRGESQPVGAEAVRLPGVLGVEAEWLFPKATTVAENRARLPQVQQSPHPPIPLKAERRDTGGLLQHGAEATRIEEDALKGTGEGDREYQDPVAPVGTDVAPKRRALDRDWQTMLAQWMVEHWQRIAQHSELTGQQLIPLLQEQARWFHDKGYGEAFDATIDLIREIRWYVKRLERNKENRRKEPKKKPEP